MEIMNEFVKTPFMRPNLENQGEIPPTGNIALSPDIWCAGTHPVANYREVLKQPDSYAAMSEVIPVENMDNYFYVRCKNRSEESTDMQVQLYYTNASLICWPSNWKAMEVDNREDKINYIPPMKPDEIGVTAAPFVWKIPQRPKVGDEYCFIARMFSDKYRNLIPSGISPIYMASIIQNNLLWAERNIAQITYNSNLPLVSANVNLNIPVDTHYIGNKWMLAVVSEKMDDWCVQVQSSRTDSDGKEIFRGKASLSKSNIPIGEFNFQPAFFTELSVMLYPPATQIQPKEGAKVVIHLYYDVPLVEMGEAKRLKAFSPKHTERVRSLWKDTNRLLNPVLVGEYVIAIR